MFPLLSTRTINKYKEYIHYALFLCHLISLRNITQERECFFQLTIEVKISICYILVHIY